MIYISASAVLKEDVFEIQSIYVLGQGDQPGFLLTKNGGWEVLQVDMDLQVIEQALLSQSFYSSRLVYSPIRQYEDDDPQSFAMHLNKQLVDSKATVEHKENFHKRLFKVLQMVGDPYKGVK